MNHGTVVELRLSVCGSLVSAEDKTEESDGGHSHPLLPIHKHDLWVISLGRWRGLWVAGRGAGSVCVTGTVLALSTCPAAGCGCVCGFKSDPRHESLSAVFALVTAQGVCV